MNIAYKEDRESHYWLRLLKDTVYLEAEKAAEFLNDCDELLRIMGSIIKTMKSKLGIDIPNS